MGLVAEVRKLLGETSGVFWTDPQIRDAINEAQVCVYAEHPRVFETSTTLGVPADSDFVSLPSGIMLPRYITSTSGDAYYTFASAADLEEYGKGWMDVSTGDPKVFVMWSTELLRIWPRPSTHKNFTLVGTPWPTACTGTVDPSLPWLVEDAVVSYATSVLFAPTRIDLAQIHMQEYSESMRDYMVQWRRAHPHAITRLAPGVSSLDARRRGDLRLSRAYRFGTGGVYA